MMTINFPLPPLHLQLSYLELMFNGAHPQAASPERVPKLDLLAYKPQEVAQQLTLLQFAFYSAIDRREMLNTAWKGKHRCRDAPNVVRAIEQGNKVGVRVVVRARVTVSVSLYDIVLVCGCVVYMLSTSWTIQYQFPQVCELK